MSPDHLSKPPLNESTLEAELFTLVRDIKNFTALERAAVDALWIADCNDLSRSWVSPRFWNILGYTSADELVVSDAHSGRVTEIGLPSDRNWREVADADDLRIFDEAIRDLGHDLEAKPISRVIRFRHAAGYALATEVTGVPCASRSGGPVDRIIGFHKDLNRRLELERLLDETNEAARVGAWSWNIATDQLYWTRMVYEIHEIADPSYVPSVETSIGFYCEGTSKATIAELINKCLTDGKRWEATLELKTAKGNVRWVHAIGHGELFEGKVVRMFGSFQDIHEQKLRDIKLATNAALLSETFELAPNGMVIADVNGSIERVSSSFCEMLGYTADELIGQTFSDFTHPEDRPGDRLKLAAFKAGTASSDRIQKRYLTKSGETVWADVAEIAIRDEAGNLTNLSTQIVDVTEARAAEALRVRHAFLEDKAREMEQFAYIASHDLRQPVLTLKGYLDALKEDFGANISEEGTHYLDVMDEAVTRMDKLMRGLLDYSRLSQPRELERVNLTSTVKEVISELESLRQSHGGAFTIDNLPTIWGHKSELSKLFQHLLANALKFHRPGVPPQVEISTWPVRGGNAFSISDNGIGIAKSDLTAVFALFRRSRIAPADVSGAGIGLASCKTIVERHGGTISASSELGVGSVFTFTLLTSRSQ